MVGTIVSDPVFQMGSIGVVMGTIAALLVLRAQVTTHSVAVARGTRLMLAFGVLSVLLVSGWSSWNILSAQGQRGVRSLSSTSSPIASSSPPAGPTTEPTQEPSPTSTPRLSRSITQVLTAFCQAISARDYQTAWRMTATSLQRRHPRTAVFAAWSHYTTCSVPDQSYDPDALELLTWTLAPGAKDQYSFTRDTDERFTMGIEAQAWKITSVCHIIAEGCFDLAWG